MHYTPVTPPTCLLPACQARPFALQDIKPSQLLGVAEAVRRSQLYSPPPGQPAEEFRSPNTHPSHAVPRPLFHYEDITITSLAGLAPHIEINPQVRERREGEWKGEGEERGRRCGREGRRGEGRRVERGGEGEEMREGGEKRGRGEEGRGRGEEGEGEGGRGE